MDVDVDGSTSRAAIDPLGGFEAEFVLSAGRHTAIATAFLTNGSVIQSNPVEFTSGAGYVHVGLGDSYSAGEGVEPYMSDTVGSACHRSRDAYSRLIEPPELGEAIRDNPDANRLQRFVACSGAVLRHLLSDAQRTHGQTNPPQLPAVNSDADLVTFTIGGNDAGFSAVLSFCATHAFCFDDDYVALTSGRKITLSDFVTAKLAVLSPELLQFYRLIRDRAPTSDIVALDYPEFFDDGIALRLGCKEAAAFDRSERVFLNDSVRLFARVIEYNAAIAGIGFADVIERFKGHRICEGGVNAASEWTSGHESSAQSLAGSGSFHPKRDGQRAYADAVTEALASGVGANVNARSVAEADASPASEQTLAAAPVLAQSPDQAITEPILSTDLTPAELAEVQQMEFGPADIASMELLSNAEAPCIDAATPGQQMLLAASDFTPGSNVTIRFEAANESEQRVFPDAQTDGTGEVRVSVVVPDVQLAPGEEQGAGFVIEGQSPRGGRRFAREWLRLVHENDVCGLWASDNGQLATPDGPAPRAVGNALVPSVLLREIRATPPVVTPQLGKSGLRSPVSGNVEVRAPLPRTGLDALWVVGVALLSLVAGLALVVSTASRRRPKSSRSPHGRGHYRRPVIRRS
ncbi:MAG: SGNH/GDSL hydrolase family protein [Actinobacteria bacterium]|nr:SGNH/GDSL hydrolase family protein [Actinomycetota bacterium]